MFGSAKVLAWREVRATLKPDHSEPGLGQFARHDAAGPAHPDHDRIDILQSR